MGMVSGKGSTAEWAANVVKQDEIDRYLVGGEDFIDPALILEKIRNNTEPDGKRVRDIIEKALSIERLEPDETAALLNVKDPGLWEEIAEAGDTIKKKVYDNRIVFFAPLYFSNYCINNCAYCGFKASNTSEKRGILSEEEIKEEISAVVSEGHKRLIGVFGEHPVSDIDYMVKAIEAVYSVKEEAPRGPGYGSIRRVNVNAPPMPIKDLKRLWEAGIGTYQVFQETYNKERYTALHPSGPKADYRWRLYSMHRAMDAGIDDLAIGALFGLYDWRFEVMGLLYHTIDLERQFGIGPHTISFPRMNEASNSPVTKDSQYRVSDEDFRRLISVIRLSVPYTGLIITAREKPEIRMDMLTQGCTQTDASTKIGIKGYSTGLKSGNKDRTYQDSNSQQFMLGDTRGMDDVVRELAERDTITSFCTAGYRCGRTGEKIMGLLKNCVEGKFCKANAVLTFKEYLDDYASDRTREVGQRLVEKELDEIKSMPFFRENNLISTVEDMYSKISSGKRDLYV
ncbi:MAG: [FeFe] hydrogenase H-cluster radical SAM maturase HydG [Chitinivibrionales bacterium]